MKELLVKEVYSKWKEIGKYSIDEGFPIDKNVYHSLLNISQVGPYYYFFFNPSKQKIELISDLMTDVLGYDTVNFTIQTLLDNVHPEDLPYFVDFERTVVDFKSKLPKEKLLKYKSRYNYRLRKADGTYAHIMQQSTTVQIDELGAVVRNLVFHTDITEIAHFINMKLSFIGYDGEPSYIDVEPLQKFHNRKVPFSNKELEILRCMVQGMSSQQISEQLFRSIHTVHTHRKNILRKSGCANVNELIVKAVREAWI